MRPWTFQRNQPTNSINSSMAQLQNNPLQSIPQALAHLIHLNIEFRVLVCLGDGCCKAVSAKGLVEHLRKYHNEKPAVRKQVQQYVQGFPHKYNYKTIVVPTDGNAPQPIIPIVDGFQCRHCRSSTQSRDAMKKHGNKAHSMKRVKDEELFQAVRLQTWFRDGKERYWVVDESRLAGQASQVGRCFIVIIIVIILTHSSPRCRRGIQRERRR